MSLHAVWRIRSITHASLLIGVNSCATLFEELTRASQLHHLPASCRRCLLAGVRRLPAEDAASRPRPQPPGHSGQPADERVVTDYADFTGRTNAHQSVDIRPRVSGYLVQMPFKEGAEVKEGDLLFEVDPRPYQAQYDQAEGKSISTRPSSSWPRPTTPATWTWPRRPAPSASSNSTRTRRRWTRPMPP